MKKNLCIGLFSLACMMLFATTAFACSCAGYNPSLSNEERMLEEYARTDVVFIGEIISTKHNPQQERMPEGIVRVVGTFELTFKVTRVVKGVKSEEVLKVTTTDISSACGIEGWGRIKVGEVWVIYATKSPTGLQTDHCTRTSPAEEAREDIAIFNKITA